MKNKPNIQPTILCALGLGLGTLALYAQTFHSSFHFDDNGFIINNPAIREVTNLKALWNALETPTRFIPFVTFAINYHFHKLDVFGYHLINFLIHLVNAGLVFWLVQLLFKISSIKDRLGPYKEIIGFWATALFLTHPAQTQAVTYIVQRFELLASMFYLMAVCFYINGRVQEDQKAMARNFVISVLAAILAVFTKEIVITLPLMIFFLEAFFLRRQKTRAFSRQQWLILQIVFLGIICLIPLFFSYRIKSILFAELFSESHDGDIITQGTFVLTQLRVALTFLRLLIFPVNQNLDYDYPLSQSFWDPRVLVSLAAIMGFLFAAFRLRKTRPLIAFGIFWFFIIFSANLVPRHNLIFEHKIYLMGIGPIVAIVSVLAEWAKDRRKLNYIFIGIISILSVLTFQRNKVWQSELTLWQDVAKKSPDKSRVNLNLGRAYYDIGKYDEALFYYNKALQLDPKNRKAYNNRGLLYYRAGNWTQALSDFNAALAVEKNYHEAKLNRANIYVAQKEFDLAMNDLNSLIEKGANFPMAFANRGSLYAKQKKFDLAIKDFNQAVLLHVDTVELYNNRANAYRFAGQHKLAMEDYKRAIISNPQYPLTYSFRSQAYYDLGEYGLAWDDAIKAKALGAKVSEGYLKSLEQRILSR